MSTSVTESISEGGIYVGYWVNWSHGSIRGATITLTQRDGGLLIAFLALFVTVAGASFWRLFCLGAHFAYSIKDDPQDGLYHQRQAILRNAATSTTGLIYFLRLLWHWRQNAQSPWIRVIPLLGASALIMGAFSVASIFSSRVSTALGDEVLISSPDCGRIDATLDSSVQDYLLYLRKYTTELTVAGATYAQQCYDTNATAQECAIFIKKEIPATVSRNLSCPFPGKEKICLRDSTNLRIDTGMINSHKDLGMNAAPEDRFAFRRVVDCAPLVTDGYTELRNASDGSTQDAYVEYYYGTRDWVSTNASRYTYDYPDAVVDNHNMNADYSIGVAWAAVSPNDSSFTPVAELRRNDAEMALFFLSANSIRFTQPADDDWFSAHQPVSTDLSSYMLQGAMTVYHRDRAASVLACTTQHQFCNPNKKNSCTALDGWRAGIAASDALWTSKAQAAAFTFWAETYTSLGCQVTDMVSNLGATSLTARDTLVEGIQGPLPTDQWQQEVEHWHASSMAKLQRIIIEAATGPSEPDMYRYLVKPNTTAEQQRCRNQKVKSTSYTSFSVLGLSLILTIGTLIILLSLLLEPLLRVLHRRRRRTLGLYQRLEWAANETLQLQRMAHEEVGAAAGTWTRGASVPPVTARGEKLAVLDIADREHPRLVLACPASPPGSGDEEKGGGLGDERREERVDQKVAPVTAVASLPDSGVSAGSESESATPVDEGDEIVVAVPRERGDGDGDGDGGERSGDRPDSGVSAL